VLVYGELVKALPQTALGAVTRLVYRASDRKRGPVFDFDNAHEGPHAKSESNEQHGGNWFPRHSRTFL